MTIANTETRLVPIDTLKAHPDNPRMGNVDVIAESIRKNGFYGSVIVRDGTNVILAGTHRWKAARIAGMTEIPVTYVKTDAKGAKRILLADNRTSDLGTYDDEALAELLGSLGNLEGTGWAEGSLKDLVAQLSADATERTLAENPTLAERFGIPPFSVLDARGGAWAERKRRWLSLGIESERGRGEDTGGGALTYARGKNANDEGLDPVSIKILRGGRKTAAVTIPSLSGRVPTYYKQKEAVEERLGRPITNAEFEADHLVMLEGGGLSSSGTSVFDPVLCEMSYRWFSPPGGTVLDPFAGGSVRGIIAGLLGRHYVGIDLRGEQVKANLEQWPIVSARAGVTDAPAPRWITGDSVGLDGLLPPGETYDLVFTCPPYADLEVYSDDPADLSTMGYDDFREAYREIIAASVDRLADDRFAAIVVGDVRDRRGVYRNFVGDTISAFVDAGADYYNEAILVTPIGSLAVRTGRQFERSRKLGKSHQNVLVFVKGDPKRAVEACGPVEVEIPPEMEVAE